METKKMNNLLLIFLAVMASKSIYGQSLTGETYDKPIKAEFLYIEVMQLNAQTEEILDEWTTLNSCTYLVNKDRTEISYTERNTDNKIVRSWRYPVINFYEDNVVYSFAANSKTVTIWKDKSMVSIEDSKDVFLVTGAYQSSTNLIDYD